MTAKSGVEYLVAPSAHISTDEPPRGQRPGLAIVANCVTPYRAHLHRLIAAGIPELKLHTLISHGPADFDWKLSIPPEINLIHFGGSGDNPIARLYHAPLREWRKGNRLSEYVRRNDVRAVICGPPRYMSYLRLFMRCRSAAIPFFVCSDANIRNEDLLAPWKMMLKRPYQRFWATRITGAMPMGEWGDQYFEQYGVPRSRMYHMPYTPDYEYFARVESQRLHQFRQRQGLSTARRHLLFCGRLVPMKRVDLLIDAFAAVADERPLWDLLIIGDGVLAGELKQRVPERLRPRVKWIGFLESDELVPAYHAADVLVLPSDREPWAVVVQEAMSAGLAVVASDVVGAARELIDDGVSGRIFSAGDVESLGRALRDVTDEQKLPAYKQRSQAGLASWRRAIDPVAEIRRALADAGVLPQAARPAATSPARQEQGAFI